MMIQKSLALRCKTFSSMLVKRIFDILPYALERHNLEAALSGKRGGKWVSYSNADYLSNVNLVSFALMKMGVNPGQRVATLSGNRPEWNFVDMGMLQVGAVHVPIYPTINNEELIYVLNESGVKIIFIGNKYLVQKVQEVQAQVPMLSQIVTFDEIVGATSFKDFIDLGEQNKDIENLKKRKKAVLPSDLASIIYTSGTTSAPKGVMLSHENHLSNMQVAAFTIRLRSGEKILSYLPLSHSYERMVNYVSQYIGLSIYYSDSVNNILANFKEIKPHILVSVPLLLERVYEGILKKGMKLSGIQKVIFNWSISVGMRYEHGKSQSMLYRMELALARKLVFRKWQDALGGRMRKIICGGAKVQNHLLKIFWAAGIPVFEGYGLTEASPLVSYNTEDDFKAETIGKPIADLLVKISENGELLVKGPNVMLGYYLHPEMTADVIDQDDWLHTGDKAELDEEGFLKITGRIKEIFKTASGVYVYPESLENRLKQSLFIANCLVVGENKNYLSAIISPNFEYIREWGAEQQIVTDDPIALLNNPKVRAQLDHDIRHYGQSVKESENIAKWEIVADEWGIDSGELTPSMKLRRRVVAQRYVSIIEQFYQ